MRVFINLFLIVLMLAAVGVGAFWMGKHRAETTASSQPAAAGGGDEDAKAVPDVVTTEVKLGTITRKIVAYGQIAVPPAEVQVLSVPFECRVVKVLALPGQRIAEDTPVIQIEPSPDAQLQMQAAKAALDAAQKDFDQTQKRFSDHLATNTDVLQSQTTLDAAKAKHDAMTKYGQSGVQDLKAKGLVSKIDVQQGQIVPAGNGLVELAAGNVQARLGVEPTDVPLLHEGDAVNILPVTIGGDAVAGKIHLIAQRINPETTLVDVYAELPAESKLPLDGFVRGEFSIESPKGLIVPRQSVLPDDNDLVVYIIDKENAERHPCKIVFQNDDQRIIEGDDLDPGDQVVIVGNLELEDDMKVHSTVASTGPSTEASTAPSSKPGEAK